MCLLTAIKAFKLVQWKSFMYAQRVKYLNLMSSFIFSVIFWKLFGKEKKKLVEILLFHSNCVVLLLCGTLTVLFCKTKSGVVSFSALTSICQSAHLLNEITRLTLETERPEVIKNKDTKVSALRESEITVALLYQNSIFHVSVMY